MINIENDPFGSKTLKALSRSSQPILFTSATNPARRLNLFVLLQPVERLSMNYSRSQSIFVATLLLFAGLCSADDLFVPVDFPTIQSAIDAAGTGDKVIVSPGTYVENIDFLGKAITVRSSDGPESTTIDGSADGSVVTINSGEGSDAQLQGFTITNGSNESGGGGIYIVGSSPTIIECMIVENNAGDSSEGGGGILLLGSGSTIIDCQINNNFAGDFSGGYGGGIAVHISDVTISGCSISQNETEATCCAEGGGIYIHSSTVTLIFCEIEDNFVTLDLPSLCRFSQVIRGGGIAIADFGDGSEVTATNVYIANNVGAAAPGEKCLTPQGGGIYIPSRFPDALELGDSTICGNAPDNINFAGEFIDLGGNTISQLCEDGDMTGDINGDGAVNGADLGILLGAWTE